MSDTAPDHTAWLEPVILACREAGHRVMAVYGTDFTHHRKADASPVTAADLAAEAVLVPVLTALIRGVPVISEESCTPDTMPTLPRRFWLVDPLDGTREFIARNGEFTVNVALVQDRVPVLGVVYAPALDVLYAAAGTAFVERAGRRQPMQARRPPAAGMTALVSRSHHDGASLDQALAAWPVRERIGVGSSLKLGLIAEGRADLYVRLGRTMEWDIAAGHAVLRAAGGEVTTPQGLPFLYGKPGLSNTGLVARGAPA
ncbi:MAG: 3'(2'),5'-bisphosphate nucleotidase CysQ [Aquabacterium sp.]